MGSNFTVSHNLFYVIESKYVQTFAHVSLLLVVDFCVLYLQSIYCVLSHISRGCITAEALLHIMLCKFLKCCNCLFHLCVLKQPDALQ
jgi:hypothetical protein